ncbi:MAG: Large-conductance mechanosensitive channel [Actinomycetota bacterium]
MKIYRGFKEFMSEGNALEVAVAFVLGAAFTMLVESLTNNLVKPLVGLVLGGGIEAGTITIDGQVINFTAMINAFITFFITAVVVYLIFVHPMNALRERRNKGTTEELTEQDYLREIRNLLAGRQADEDGEDAEDSATAKAKSPSDQDGAGTAG